MRVVAMRANARLGSLTNFGNATKSLYSDAGKLADFLRPFPEVESTLDLISEASIDLDATHMANQPLTALQLVRLAEFVSPEEWVRPLNEWEPPESIFDGTEGLPLSQQRKLQEMHADSQLDSLLRHLLLKYDDAPRALLNSFTPLSGLQPAQHWARAESPFLSEDNWLMSYRFARLLVAVGAGQSAAKAMKAHLSPAVSKPMAHAFMQTPFQMDSPLHAFRSAQVAALGGSEGMQVQVCSSQLGFTLGDAEEEEFAASMLLWLCDREDELRNVTEAGLMNHLMASYEAARVEGKPYSMKGKTVNSVLKSAQGVGELFYPSGLRGMRTTGVDFQGREAEIVVEELLSAESLLTVGEAMRNCLRTGRGLAKYCHRARSRSSSFWAVSARRGGGARETAEYMLIFEVWNQSRIVHQAEGPGSSFPSDVPLGYMQMWAEEQQVEWSTWEVW